LFGSRSQNKERDLKKSTRRKRRSGQLRRLKNSRRRSWRDSSW